MRYMRRPDPIPGISDEIDELFKEAVEIITQYERANATLLQRRLSIGYARAARLIDQLEAAGVVGPDDGSKPREVLIHSPEELLGREGSHSESQQDNVFEVTANYKIPTDVNLGRVEKPDWGKQLGDVVGTEEFKNTKINFPILLRAKETTTIYTPEENVKEVIEAVKTQTT